MRNLKITCLGYLDFKSGKVYKTKAGLLLAQLKKKSLLGLAVMRKLLIEAKIAILKLRKYTWELSCKIASLVNELKAMKIGHSDKCNSFLKLSYSDRRKL